MRFSYRDAFGHGIERRVSCICCMNCVWKNVFEKQNGDILLRKHGIHCSYKQTHAPLKTLHFSTRCQIDFKQVILTLYEKHKQKFFIRRMWNTIPTFATTLQRTDHFRFRHSYCKKDVKNVNMCFPCCIITLGSKNMRLRSTRGTFLISAASCNWY